MEQADEKSILEEKIKKIDQQISLLTDLKEKVTAQLQSVANPSQSAATNFSPEEKIALFKSFFIGRSDVCAHFWLSKRTGKRGYSPICQHEWVRSICRKPAIKCSECPNQGFVPFDESIIRQHLTGKQVIGVYPMLKNEKCCFLAIDFDGGDWFSDVNAVKDTCQEINVPTAIERSRSGKGGHLWIFFSEELPASLARQLGSCLITKTMAKRYQIEMKSYDRFFPNQDTLPKGGFGNLIALPFQKEAVANSNSVFIDETGNPHKDQWQVLASIRKMSYQEVATIVNEAAADGQVINVRLSPIDENDEPWLKLPSGKQRFKTEINDPPESVEAILANRIYVKTDKNQSVLLNQLKHLAAFQNPEFYKKQKMRFSTHATPRIICCAEIEAGYLSLPRGCLDDMQALLNEYGIKLAVQDKRTTGEKISCSFKGVLNKGQKSALKNILLADFGVLAAPPGAGKTVLAIAAIAKRKTNTLILVHRKPLMAQWQSQLSKLLGKDKKEIGQIGGGKNKATGKIDVAMVQTMDKKDGVDNRIADYGFVVIDECHHVGAFSFEKVLAQAKAKYVLGLTATPYRRDGHQPIIHMQCGPICHLIKQKDFNTQAASSIVVPCETGFNYPWDNNSKIHDLWDQMIIDEQRNQLILADLLKALDEGRFPLVLTERRDHLQQLSTLIKDKVDLSIILCGGVKQKSYREMLAKLKECPDKCRKVILATGSYIGEGFDEPRLDTLFLTMPSSFKGKIVQYAGRLHRYHKDKQNIRVYDYVDKGITILAAMYKKRLKTYKMLGYTVAGEQKLLLGQ